MNRIGVLQVIDTLSVGGAERVAVNLANLLPRAHYTPYLCSTRADGPLADSIAPDVGRLRLERKWRFDPKAIWALSSFIKANQIKILHAHGTAVFIGLIASLLPPHPMVVWHVHFGRHALENRRSWPYRLAGRHADGVVTVSQSLRVWLLSHLRVPSAQVWYVPNFSCERDSQMEPVDLPGQAGKRIVCVANLRSEKDHLTLLRALALVIQSEPEAHLLLVGAVSDSAYLDLLCREIIRLGIDHHVSLLGPRQDVPNVLGSCDIGVLSSASEGFPLALIEYGMAKLPAVATRVGQCPEILDEGSAGVLVAAGSPEALSEALLMLLSSSEGRAKLGEHFYQRIQEVYSPGSIVGRICQVYDSVLSKGRGE
jgi:glycosyltransferase involved in cell wall biosynthesis